MRTATQLLPTSIQRYERMETDAAALVRSPILMTKDLARVVHISGGRMCEGFARGDQASSVVTIGQKVDAVWTAAIEPGFVEHDKTNRELLNEHYGIFP